jgi:hypothetical protein
MNRRRRELISNFLIGLDAGFFIIIMILNPDRDIGSWLMGAVGVVAFIATILRIPKG